MSRTSHEKDRLAECLLTVLPVIRDHKHLRAFGGYFASMWNLLKYKLCAFFECLDALLPTFHYALS